MKRALAALALLPVAIAIGLVVGGLGGAVITGTWFARDVLRPVGLTVSSAGAGTGELLVPEEPKEASPPSAVVEPLVPPPSPVLAPEDIVVSTPAPEPVVAVPAVTTAPPSAKDDPGAEVPGSCFILQERYCRGAVLYRNKNSEVFGVQFSPPPGATVFMPVTGVLQVGTATFEGGDVVPRLMAFETERAIIQSFSELNSAEKWMVANIDPLPGIKEGVRVERGTPIGVTRGTPVSAGSFLTFHLGKSKDGRPDVARLEGLVSPAGK